MISCVFPGSFDPVTRGHINLISRTSALFDRVTVTVMINIHKSGAIPVEKRIELLKKACRPYPNVKIDSWDGLLADYMKQKKEMILIRGVRSMSEMDQEYQSCAANKLLHAGFETLLLPSDPLLTGVSSSAVREIAAFGGSIREFVPEELTEEITALLSKK